MILYPAIDLKGGEAVRLAGGDMAKATVYNSDPAAQARAFAEAGFSWLHLVDLDGAFAGKPVNVPAVTLILAATGLPVQLGGGIRDRATIETWLEAGVRRVILGTAAVKDPALVIEACRAHPGRIAVGLDARGGRVAVEGWAEVSELTVVEAAMRFEGAGVAAIIHTDISRDGLGTGVNVGASANLARNVSIPVIASGGVAGLADIERLTGPEGQGIAGVVIGRALYTGALDPAQALALVT